MTKLFTYFAPNVLLYNYLIVLVLRDTYNLGVETRTVAYSLSLSLSLELKLSTVL